MPPGPPAQARNDSVRSARNGNEVQEAQKGCQAVDRDPEGPAAAATSGTREKPGRGARGKPGATQFRNALERGIPREQRATGRLTPVRSATDFRGEQGLEAELDPGHDCDFRITTMFQIGATAGGQRASRGAAAPRQGKASKGKPQERYRFERAGWMWETKRGRRARNPEAAPEPGRGNSRVSGFPLPHALKGQKLQGRRRRPRGLRQALPVIL